MNKEEIIKAKKELNEYKYNKILIQYKIKDLEQKKATINKLTSTYNNSIGSSSNKIQDKFAEDLVGLLDIQKEIEEEAEKLKEKNKKVENKINSIEQPYRNILYFRYIKGKSLTDISNIIGKHYDYTRKLHTRALIKYLEICYIWNLENLLKNFKLVHKKTGQDR